MVEIIGFIISLLALLYLFIQQNAPSKQKRYSSVEQEEEEMGDPLRELLRVMEKEVEAKQVHHLPPPPPAPKKRDHPKKSPSSLEKQRLASSIENRHLKSALEERQIQSRLSRHEDYPGRTLAHSFSHMGERNEKLKVSRLEAAVRRLSHRRDLIIYQEIMEKPKSLRSEFFLNENK